MRVLPLNFSSRVQDSWFIGLEFRVPSLGFGAQVWGFGAEDPGPNKRSNPATINPYNPKPKPYNSYVPRPKAFMP